MRLREVERGDGLANRLLIAFISVVSRMRLPDAARVACCHGDFGSPLGTWTQAAMRVPSTWAVGERELMAAMVAKWNSCTFCLGAHRAVAAKQLPAAAVDGTLAEFPATSIPNGLEATLAFLEKMTLRPRDLTKEARMVLRTGVTPKALTDAIAVASLFNLITRYADALEFAIRPRPLPRTRRHVRLPHQRSLNPLESEPESAGSDDLRPVAFRSSNLN